MSTSETLKSLFKFEKNDVVIDRVVSPYCDAMVIMSRYVDIDTGKCCYEVYCNGRNRTMHQNVLEKNYILK